MQDMRKGVADAARAPLQDFNLIKETPHATLARIRDPYAPPPAGDCDAIAYEVAQLDIALGPDADAPTRPDGRTMTERGRDMAAIGAADLAKGAAVGWIPARGLIRRATGAEKHQRELEALIERGQIRRAFLKGVGTAHNCAPPAAPTPISARQAMLDPR
jgi:hypothetical protein